MFKKYYGYCILFHIIIWVLLVVYIYMGSGRWDDTFMPVVLFVIFAMLVMGLAAFWRFNRDIAVHEWFEAFKVLFMKHRLKVVIAMLIIWKMIKDSVLLIFFSRIEVTSKVASFVLDFFYHSIGDAISLLYLFLTAVVCWLIAEVRDNRIMKAQKL